MDLLELQPQHFDTIAEAWIATGATGFGIWLNGLMLSSWPPYGSFCGEVVSAEFKTSTGATGELRVGGLDRKFVEAPLQAEAKLISALLELDGEANQLAEELMTARDHLVALYSLTQATRNCLELEETLIHLTREAKLLLKAEHSVLSLKMWEEAPITIHYPQPLIPNELLMAWQADLQVGQLPYMMVENTRIAELPHSYNALLVPLPIHGAEYGVLGVFRKQADNFKSPAAKLAGAIADFATAHIENIFLIQEKTELARLHTEMELAKRVQLSLLPRTPPLLAGIDIWGASRPASQVGGDFYDYMVKPDQSFTFMVGDISGKGLSAALLMGMIRTMLRTQVSAPTQPTPEIVISRSNMNLYSDFTELSRFVTVFVGQYDVCSRGLIYANAGHSPVIFCPQGGRAGMLKADGTAMGVLPESLSRNQHLILQRGDVLIVGTDGLAEASNFSKARFGYQRLLELTESMAHLTAREIGNGIFEKIKEFSAGVPQEDDQTLVVLKSMA